MKVLELLVVSIAVSFSAAARYVRTPLGLTWDECRYEIGNGAHIIENDNGKTTIIHQDGRVQRLEPCPKPFIRNSASKSSKRDSPSDGWQVWSAYNNENNATFTSFLGSFNVPTAPSNWDGGILYFFTGLQNDNWIPEPSAGPTPPGFDIIQPVLQYGGDSEDGGGNYWALASWYVTVDSNSLWSNVTTVNAGDVIFGNMTKVGASSWYIGGSIKSTGVNTFVTVTYDRLSTQPWAYCTMEVYEIDDCSSDFPPASSPMQFTGLELRDAAGSVTPDWQALNNQADHCGATMQVVSADAVTITF